MSFWDRLLAALRREKQDIDEAVGDFESRANENLDRREREMNATPEEKLAIEQERAREIDDEFEAVRRRIEGDDQAT
jgi:hypothetical protein